MGTPLTTLTEKPIQYSTFSFGGDDTTLGKSGLFGTVVEWDLNAKNDCFKANFVFFIKRAFAFFDAIGFGTFCFGFSGFHGKLKECERYQTGLSRNAEARQKIVSALGGEAVCRSIPVVQLNPGDFTDYLKLGDNYFRGGQWVVQGEDLAGRKFVVMRLSDRTGNVHIATAHQRYRETCIDGKGFYGDGSLWTVNFVSQGREPRIPVETARVVEFIEKVRTLRHDQFSVAAKP